MNIKIVSGKYKSIGKLEWLDVPRFAVLTGINGSGKTQFLELLYHGIKDPNGNYEGAKLIVEDEDFDPKEITYLPVNWSFGELAPTNFSNLHGQVNNLFSEFKNPRRSGTQAVWLREYYQEKLQKPYKQISKSEFVEHLPDDYAISVTDNAIHKGLAAIFLRYRTQFLELKGSDHSDIEIFKNIGPKPWEVLNSVLQAADFPYRINNPENTNLYDDYQIKLTSSDGAVEIQFSDLSSGETALMSLFLSLYSSQHHKRLPKLMIMDEPDAHLHPSMTKQFLEVLKSVFVEKYNVRVIMSTHSPSTVALAPEESIFEMRGTQPRIVKSPSKWKTTNLLTEGLITIGPNTKYVLVEDDDDVDFYNTTWNLATKTELIDLEPPVVFIPASVKLGSSKVHGGKSVVEGWVKKLQDSGLQSILQGLIDRDVSNVASHGIHVTSRYSIENYLLDPLNVFGLLLDKKEAPALSTITLSPGEEYKLRSLDQKSLQEMADSIIRKVETHPSLSNADKTPAEVSFRYSVKLKYPKWILEMRGKDLLPAFQSCFGGPKNLHLKNLLHTYEKVQMISDDLIDTFKDIQQFA